MATSETILFSDNFDNYPNDALPAGYVAINGTWALTTTNAVSGKGLASSTNVLLDNVLYTSALMTDGTVTLDYKVPSDKNPPNQCGVSITFRCAADFSTGYYIGYGDNDKVSFYQRTDEHYIKIGDDTPATTVVSWVAGDQLRKEVKFVGSAIEFRLWNITQGQTRPLTATFSATDTTYTSGYAGFVGIQTGNRIEPTVDNFVLTAIDNTSTHSVVTIARDNTALYYSPSNWCDDGVSKVTANAGAYIKFNFTGTSLTLLTSALASMSSYPIVRAIIDGVWYNVPLTQATSYVVVSGLTAGTHSCKLYLRSSLYSAGSWWNLVNALKITGFQLDDGASILPSATVRPKLMIVFGDSLTQGFLLDGNNSPSLDDATGNYVNVMAEAFNAEYAQIGWGGTNFASAGVSDVPAFNVSYASVANGYSRLTSGKFTTQPDYITVMLGTNGTPTQTDVATAISNLRNAAPNAWVFVIVPGCGQGRTAIKDAVNAAITAGDTKVVLIDAGTRYQSGINPAGSYSPTEACPADGVHYGRSANARLGAEWVRQIQHALEPRRFTIVAS